MTPRVHIGAATDSPAARAAASSVARTLQLPLSQGRPTPGDAEGWLAVCPDGIELHWLIPTAEQDGPRSHPIRVDLTAIDTRSGPGRSLRQPLARAVGLRRGEPRPSIVDATGGLGEDAWVLASLGCGVTVLERHPVVAALLSDGLARAGRIDPGVAARMRLQQADARSWLTALAEAQRPDVVYLDPMFPARSGSALERRPMRILRQLVGADADAVDLARIARRVARRRVVIKRPADAPPLLPEPVARHEARGLRFDVYPAGGQPDGGQRVDAEDS